MKRILLASAACLALSFPAMAQNNTTTTQPNAQQQTRNNQPQNRGQQNSQIQNQAQQQNGSQQMQASNGQQAQAIQPSSLNKQDVRQIQQALDKDGFKAKKVDGIWGRETADALRSFQKAKNLPGNGELNQQTLAALGVNISNASQAQNANPNQNPQQRNASSGQQSQSQTVGQAPRNPPSRQNPQHK